MDACELCKHDWHGASLCHAKVSVEVTERMYFTERGAGPMRALDTLTTPGKVEEASARCACRG